MDDDHEQVSALLQRLLVQRMEGDWQASLMQSKNSVSRADLAHVEECAST